MDKYEALRQYFGHESFRGGQEPLIDSILAGRDALGIMPTGGGKSICYQIPALLLPGLSLVISPLISLMKDQVAALEAAGIEAVFLNSAMSQEEFLLASRQVRSGRCTLVYIAPERLDNERFLSFISRQKISLVAVDEAHCVSQWGQDFRPSYLRIASFVESLPERPVVAAFTATATRRVQEDILRGLGLRDPVQVVTGFDRPNLFFDVLRPRHKLPVLLELVEERRDKSGIVYCSTRANVERVHQALLERGVPAARYHAGLSDEERRRSQEDFQYDRRPVMVATNAFGMGIDKSNVGYVIHYNMPKDLESYYQEAGRAGRDGEPADCILLFSQGDIVTAKYLIQNSTQEMEGEEARALQTKQELERLSAMAGYCKTDGCLRGYILAYFGQPHPDRCGSCGSCQREESREDITVPAQKVLSCVVRVHRKLGYYVGPALVLNILRGSRDKRIKALGLDTLPTFGLMEEVDRGRVREYIDCLEAQGYLFVESDHGTLRPTKQADEVLFRGEKVTAVLRTAALTRRAERAKAREEEKARPRTPRDWAAQAAAARPLSGISPAGETAAPRPEPAGKGETTGLLEALRRERTRLAQEAGVPAYVIFSNATLADMAEKVPTDILTFLNVSGVGAVKAERYGREFLRVIRGFLGTQEDKEE